MNKKSVHVISLGCARNTVDSENMAGILTQSHAYELHHDPDQSDVIIVNTCGFIDSAKEESVNTILEAAEKKRTAKCSSLVVTGCLSERYSQELKNDIPEIDLIMGTAAFSHIFEELEKIKDKQGDGALVSVEHPRLKDYDLPRVNSQEKHHAYLKIAEGCAKKCSFCIIPKLRGPLRSRSIESLCLEATNLCEGGVKELNLIAQDLTDYGRDRQDESNLFKLLTSLTEIEKLHWLRLFYTYPDQLSSEVIELIKTNPKICNYIDIPLQHINDKMLQRMNRKTNRDQIYSIISQFKKDTPDFILRSSLMVGFPGESEKDFLELCDFVQEGHIDQLGVFTYSHETGTPSFMLPDIISAEEKTERQEELFKIQSQIQHSKLQDFVGKKVEVLMEGVHPETDSLLWGRHYGQAPEVDNKTIINDGVAAKGDFVNVEITEIVANDLLGRIL